MKYDKKWRSLVDSNPFFCPMMWISFFSWSDNSTIRFSVCTTAFPCANTCNKRKSVSLKDATSIKEVVTFGEVWAPPPHSTHTLKRTLMFTQTQKWAEGQLIPYNKTHLHFIWELVGWTQTSRFLYEAGPRYYMIETRSSDSSMPGAGVADTIRDFYFWERGKENQIIYMSTWWV